MTTFPDWEWCMISEKAAFRSKANKAPAKEAKAQDTVKAAHL